MASVVCLEIVLDNRTNEADEQRIDPVHKRWVPNASHFWPRKVLVEYQFWNFLCTESILKFLFLVSGAPTKFILEPTYLSFLPLAGEPILIYKLLNPRSQYGFFKTVQTIYVKYCPFTFINEV